MIVIHAKFSIKLEKRTAFLGEIGQVMKSTKKQDV